MPAPGSRPKGPVRVKKKKLRKPNVSKSTVEKLEEENARMEARLADLRNTISKNNKDYTARTASSKNGVFWENARPAKDFTGDVLKRAKQSKGLFRPGSRSGRKPVGGPQKKKTTRVKRVDPQGRTHSYNPPFRGVSALATQQDLAATRRVTSRPGGQEMPESMEGTPGSLLHGNYDERAAANAFKQARTEWLQNAEPLAHNSSTQQQAGQTTATATTSASSTAASSSFDEAASHASFVNARQEWLSSLQPNNKNNKPKVIIERNEASARNALLPTGKRSGHSIAVSDGLTVLRGSLLDTQDHNYVEFDEQQSHSDFKAARSSWLGSVNDAYAKVAQEQQQQPATTLGDWNVSLSQDSTVEDLLGLKKPSTSKKQHTITPSSSGGLSEELKKHEVQEKFSCYNCYNVLYSDQAIVLEKKRLCSAACVTEYENTKRIECVREDCVNKFFKRQGQPSKHGLTCGRCSPVQTEVATVAGDVKTTATAETTTTTTTTTTTAAAAAPKKVNIDQFLLAKPKKKKTFKPRATAAVAMPVEPEVMLPSDGSSDDEDLSQAIIQNVSAVVRAVQDEDVQPEVELPDYSDSD